MIKWTIRHEPTTMYDIISFSVGEQGILTVPVQPNQDWTPEALRKLFTDCGGSPVKSYIIELRCDDDTDEKDKIILDAMKTLAKHAFTTACLIAGKRRPQIALRTSDMFVAEQEISLAGDISQEEVSAEEEDKKRTHNAAEMAQS